MALEKAENLQQFYKKTISSLKKLRSKKYEEWQHVIEDTRAKIEDAKQHLLQEIEKYFLHMQDSVVNEFLVPSRETSFERIELPIKVLLIRK